MTNWRLDSTLLSEGGAGLISLGTQFQWLLPPSKLEEFWVPFAHGGARLLGCDSACSGFVQETKGPSPLRLVPRSICYFYFYPFVVVGVVFV